MGQLPLPSVSARVYKISEKGAELHPKPRTWKLEKGCFFKTARNLRKGVS